MGSAPATPFPNGLPGGTSSAPPTNVDSDPQVEDINSNGEFRFTDVIEFVFALDTLAQTDLTDRQRRMLDHDGDGAVSFTDVIDLVFQLP